MTVPSSSRAVAVGHAHAKVILVGEHAVLYGQPALAMPLQALSMRAVIAPTNGPLVLDCPIYFGPLREAPLELSGIATAFAQALDHLGARREGLSLSLRSSMPMVRGLGSSAASAAAVVRAVYACFGATVDEHDLRRFVDLAEDQVHGTASGIDSAGVIAQGPFLFRVGQPPKKVEPGAGAVLVVGDTGSSAETRSAVAAVRRLLDARTQEVLRTMAALGELALSAQRALEDGNLSGLGEALDAAQQKLEALGVSHPKLEELVRAARAAGAIGAKLTGGGRGGCMIALAADDAAARDITQALHAAGATGTWQQPIGGNAG
ncbi:MAG: mevalonate kinase [Thermaerobacter sp.]|nr:mevalonate kinase [Thermaerobacter sp.]